MLPPFSLDYCLQLGVQIVRDQVLRNCHERPQNNVVTASINEVRSLFNQEQLEVGR